MSDFLFEKDKIFAYMNLDNAELALYGNQYFSTRSRLSVAPPEGSGDLSANATGRCCGKGVSKKGDPAEKEISPEYLEAVANAYEHFFFRYSASNLLVVDTSEIRLSSNDK